MSRHERRQQIARAFGATDIVTERGDDGVARIKDLTDGVGADAVLECVGTQESMLQAIGATRPGRLHELRRCPARRPARRPAPVLRARSPPRRPCAGPPIPVCSTSGDRVGRVASGRQDPSGLSGRRRCSTGDLRNGGGGLDAALAALVGWAAVRVIDQARLWFRQGTSDKVYEVDLVEAAAGQYVVNFRFGRRGRALQDGTKTPLPVALDKAREIAVLAMNPRIHHWLTQYCVSTAPPRRFRGGFRESERSRGHRGHSSRAIQPQA